MPFTAADVRAYATGGSIVTSSPYQEGSSSPVTVYKKNGAIYYTSGMSIDCDGQPGSLCNQTTDPYFQSSTAWNQSNGQPLKAEVLPYVVIPLPSSRWNYADSGIKGGNLVLMCYKDKYVFGVVGDLGPSQRIGEGSYAAAKVLGINPDPRRGGVGSGVTYVVFPGVAVKPIENAAEAERLGNIKVPEWLGISTEPEEPPVEEPPVPVDTVYTVVAGDTLSRIAAKYSTTVEKLVEWNGIANPDLISVGQRLVVKKETPPTTPPVLTTQHVVAQGETLSGIAAKYAMTVDEVVTLNHLVFAGQVLAVHKPDPYAAGLPVANSNNPSARALQDELKRIGYMDTSVAPADTYGPKTQEAVAEFHNANPQFKDPNSTYDVTISRAGWDYLRNMATPAAKLKALVSEVPTKVTSPVPGYEVSYPYGVVDTKYAAGYHTGSDYTAPVGKAVVAVLDGEIVWANDQGGAYGRWVGLRANGRDYVYCHLDAIHVGATTGARVKAGQIIGFVGMTGNTTGPHLHFEDRPAGGGYGSGRDPEW